MDLGSLSEPQPILFEVFCEGFLALLLGSLYSAVILMCYYVHGMPIDPLKQTPQPGSTGQGSETKDYFDKHLPRLYALITEHNYMHHNEIFAALAKQLETFTEPIRILDIGCGNADRMTETLTQASSGVHAYHAVDLSSTAIDQAKRNSRKLEANTHFVEGQFREVAEQLTDNLYDVIWSSYCLHHDKDYADKKDFLEKARNKLSSKPGSMILIADTVRNEDEDFKAIQERIIKDTDANWTEVNSQISEPVIERGRVHVRESDFPASMSELKRIAAKLNLKMEVLWTEDKYRLIKLTRD